MKRFSDLVESTALQGEKVYFTDVLNKPIFVYAWRITPSKVHKDEDCLMLQFAYKTAPEEMHVTFSGSKVLMRQLAEVEITGEHEFETVITKVKQYYQFS